MTIKSIITLLIIAGLLAGCGENETEHKETAAHEKAESAGHDAGGGPEHEESGVVNISPEQMQQANIKVSPLLLQLVSVTLRAPGEVRQNAYRTVKITPRIAAQIAARHKQLGDIVTKGETLLTLSSVEMAEAQGQLIVTDREWRRVRKLGRKVVSERRYTKARINRDQALARVQAYGMTATQIDAMLASKKGASANGKFQLLAPQAGRIVHDQFIVGERVEAGYELMEIADEATMWIEARIATNEASLLAIGNTAQVTTSKRTLPARLIQLHHSLDKTTRTLSVRLEVDNPDDALHPGMFVSTRIQGSEQERALSLPEAAVLRSADGDWQVLVEQDVAGEFKAVEVEVVRVFDGVAIIRGIKPATRVVTRGAFFVQSELAKSGFSVHNH
ncbi:MAG: efflux RND transporter periplasmic adaptor subunit [Gammaproteobacteria bacterium]|nr:MAG: efflux RND transporter periplasmic adaptor subunit [Gammaproteobacteria bacterium]